jgi:serine/threonine protein kinase
MYILLMFYYTSEIVYEDYEAERIGNNLLEIRQGFEYALISFSMASLASCAARIARVLIFFDGVIFALTLGRTLLVAFAGFNGEAIFFLVNIIIIIVLPIFDVMYSLRRNEVTFAENNSQERATDGDIQMRNVSAPSRVPDYELFDGFRARIDKLPGRPIAATNIPWSVFTSIQHRIDSSSCHIYTAFWDDRPVILKLIKADRVSSPVAIAEFETEAEVLGRLNHPHIVRFLGSGFQPRRFLVLELLDGGSLSHALGVRVDSDQKSWRRTFNYLETLKLSRAMASSLNYLHSEWDSGISIIHRDLKPDNIGFTSDGNIKVFDFGLCSVVKKFKSKTDVYHMTGNTGTLRYMAPEVALGKHYNASVDVYSFGIIVWQMLKGSVPFQGMGRKTFMERVVQGGERPKCSRHWPKRFSKLLQSCWNEDSLQRPDFSEIIKEINALIFEVESSPSYRLAIFLTNFCMPSEQHMRNGFYVMGLGLVISIACTVALGLPIGGISFSIIFAFFTFVFGTTSFRLGPSATRAKHVPSHDTEGAVVSGFQSLNPLLASKNTPKTPAKLHGVDM